MVKWLHGIQTLLNLTWFITLRTESNLERFVWSHYIKRCLYLGDNFIFTTKVLHLVSLWRWGFLKLGNGLFNSWKTKFQCKLKERLLRLKRWHHFREKLSLPPPYCILNSLACVQWGRGEGEKGWRGIGDCFFSPLPFPLPFSHQPCRLLLSNL